MQGYGVGSQDNVTMELHTGIEDRDIWENKQSWMTEASSASLLKYHPVAITHQHLGQMGLSWREALLGCRQRRISPSYSISLCALFFQIKVHSNDKTANAKAESTQSFLRSTATNEAFWVIHADVPMRSMDVWQTLTGSLLVRLHCEIWGG